MTLMEAVLVEAIGDTFADGMPKALERLDWPSLVALAKALELIDADVDERCSRSGMSGTSSRTRSSTRSPSGRSSLCGDIARADLRLEEGQHGRPLQGEHVRHLGLPPRLGRASGESSSRSLAGRGFVVRVERGEQPLVRVEEGTSSSRPVEAYSQRRAGLGCPSYPRPVSLVDGGLVA